jgi:hypothetical protein
MASNHRPPPIKKVSTRRIGSMRQLRGIPARKTAKRLANDKLHAEAYHSRRVAAERVAAERAAQLLAAQTPEQRIADARTAAQTLADLQWLNQLVARLGANERQPCTCDDSLCPGKRNREVCPEY